MKKLFTLVCGVLFAMFANAATLDIGEPSNNVKDGETVWCLIREKVVTFRMVKLNLLLSIFCITK